MNSTLQGCLSPCLRLSLTRREKNNGMLKRIIPIIDCKNIALKNCTFNTLTRMPLLLSWNPVESSAAWLAQRPNLTLLFWNNWFNFISLCKKRSWCNKEELVPYEGTAASLDKQICLVMQQFVAFYYNASVNYYTPKTSWYDANWIKSCMDCWAKHDVFIWNKCKRWWSFLKWAMWE